MHQSNILFISPSGSIVIEFSAVWTSLNIFLYLTFQKQCFTTTHVSDKSSHIRSQCIKCFCQFETWLLSCLVLHEYIVLNEGLFPNFHINIICLKFVNRLYITLGVLFFFLSTDLYNLKNGLLVKEPFNGIAEDVIVYSSALLHIPLWRCIVIY